MKRIFEKMCSVAVIVWMFYHCAWLKFGRTALELAQEFYNDFLRIQRNNALISLVVSIIIALILLFWILSDRQDWEDIRESVEEEKKQREMEEWD